MVKIREYIAQHRPVVVLMAIVLLLTTVPVFETAFVVGDAWQGIMPAFADEPFNPARVQTIIKGHPTEGNPYFFEHRDDLPLVIFAGTWINAIPQLAGLSYNTSLLLNFILWSLLFAASLYYLFREVRAPPWVAVFGTLCIYLQTYAHVWRPVNLQPVFPFYFLFYIALVRIIREQSRRNIMLLAFATGVMFYLQSYLWQSFVITLGVLFFYTLFRKNWTLMKATLLSSFIGGVIGLPVPLYALWLSHTSPYFWESVGRLGLVNSHLPMADIVYSGGWVGVTIAFIAILYWRGRALRQDKEFALLGTFSIISGLGLWIMQGSNLITGKLLETGGHITIYILSGLVFFTFCMGAFLWKRRTQLSKRLRTFSVIMVILLSIVNVYYTYNSFSPLLTPNANRAFWQEEQLYAKPFTWLQSKEPNAIVVWSNPKDYLTPNLPTLTRHYVLYTWAGMMELVPESEVRERYLISQYFNNPTIADLKSNSEMSLYLGRHDFPHEAKTIERGVKICRIVFFWDKNKDCGTIPTPQSLLGDKFFTDLENKFQTDIKPNIKVYLKKYHVSYILKDKILDQQYHPEKLGAVLVYTDDRYEIYHLK